MDNTEFDKYVDLIASMSIDYKMRGITKETYISNLKIMSDILYDDKDNEHVLTTEDYEQLYKTACEQFDKWNKIYHDSADKKDFLKRNTVADTERNYWLGRQEVLELILGKEIDFTYKSLGQTTVTCKHHINRDGGKGCNWDGRCMEDAEGICPADGILTGHERML